MAGTDEYGDKLDAMQDRIDEAIKAAYLGNKDKFVDALKHGVRCAVIYSAYSNDDNDLPTNNLDEVPYKGTFTVKGDYHEYWNPGGQGGTYVSEPITDPTWLQLAVLANDSIHATQDFHHVFFESVEKDG